MDLENIESGFIDNLGQQFAVSSAAIKLVLSVFASYPLAFLYRKFIYNKSEEVQSLYFVLTGLVLGYWNYGYNILHCLVSILFTYSIIHIFKATVLGLAINFFFLFIYLLTGYYTSSTDSYDITWTMPYCILVLRLLGVAFDVYDGGRPKHKLSSDSAKTALERPPTVLQMLAHSFFPSGFLVGPQFSMRRYLDFVHGKFHSEDSDGNMLPPDSLKASMKRFSQGVIYLSIYQTLSLFLSDDFILSNEFAQMRIFKKLLIMGIWGRFALYKYISCWLLAEGACILFGLSYSGEVDGIKRWDGTTNIKIGIFENSTEFNHYIMSFNVNTNQWVAQHIYKRLKFLGSKLYSQLGVLLFLSVWHGIHSGYYVTFLHEFIVIYVERDFQSFVKSNETVKDFFNRPEIKMINSVLLRLYTFIFMGWSMLPFVFLKYPKYLKAMANCSYSGFFIHYLWLVLYGPILRLIFRKTKISSSTVLLKED